MNYNRTLLHLLLYSNLLFDQNVTFFVHVIILLSETARRARLTFWRYVI